MTEDNTLRQVFRDMCIWADNNAVFLHDELSDLIDEQQIAFARTASPAIPQMEGMREACQNMMANTVDRTNMHIEEVWELAWNAALQNVPAATPGVELDFAPDDFPPAATLSYKGTCLWYWSGQDAINIKNAMLPTPPATTKGTDDE